MTREEAINLLDNLIGMVEDNQSNNYDEAFKMAIRSLKSWDEDVPPVVHGEWIPRQDLIQGEIYDGHRCSNCGTWKSAWEKYNYCPNCGADMRGGTE